MKLRVNVQNVERGEPLYHKDIEMPFLPPTDMHLLLGQMPNRDIVAGPVTTLEHDCRTGITYVTCLVDETDEDMDQFAQLNNWSKGYG